MYFLVGHRKFLVRNGEEFGYGQGDRWSRERCVTCYRLDLGTSWRHVELLLPGWIWRFFLGRTSQTSRGTRIRMQGKSERIDIKNIKNIDHSNYSESLLSKPKQEMTVRIIEFFEYIIQKFLNQNLTILFNIHSSVQFQIFLPIN